MFCCANAYQMCRVMQWRQCTAVFNPFYYAVIDQYRLCKFLTTVNNTMSDCDQIGYQFRLVWQDGLYDKIKSFLMSGAGTQVGIAFGSIKLPLDFGVIEV